MIRKTTAVEARDVSAGNRCRNTKGPWRRRIVEPQKACNNISNVTN